MRHAKVVITLVAFFLHGMHAKDEKESKITPYSFIYIFISIAVGDIICFLGRTFVLYSLGFFCHHSSPPSYNVAKLMVIYLFSRSTFISKSYLDPN